jgi:hypothetical protein
MSHSCVLFPRKPTNTHQAHNRCLGNTDGQRVFRYALTFVIVERMFERPLRIRVSEKDTRRISFTVRDGGSTIVSDLSNASSILLEWENALGVPQTPIALSATTLGASWSAGLVIADITPSNITALVGANRFALTVVDATTTRTVQTGIIEVSDRAADTKTVS